MDTALAFNTSSSPRIDILQSLSDVERLQKEGLLPLDLRYDWKRLVTKSYFDFNKQILVVYYGGLRTTPGYLLTTENVELPRFIWEDGTRNANVKTYEVPPEVSRANKPASSVAIYAHARSFKPFGIDVAAFQGKRVFEFKLENGGTIGKTANFEDLGQEGTQ